MFLKAVLLRVIQMDFRAFLTAPGESLLKCRLRPPQQRVCSAEQSWGLSEGISNLHPSDAGAAVWGPRCGVTQLEDRFGSVTKSLWASAISLRMDGTADIQ